METETKKCAQCGKERPVAEMKLGKTTERRSGGTVKVEHWFCVDSPCRGYYQMGSEG